jgi:elongation factor P
MAQIGMNDLRKRAKVILEGKPWLIVENEMVKPGKGQAFSRVKMKNLLNGRQLERTFKSFETIEEAEIIVSQMEYLYNDSEKWTFMNTTTYEQVEIQKEIMEEESKWLKENTVCEVSFWGDRVISVTPPTFMELTITYTEPAVRGDTANNVMKKAKIETGAEINVPLFIEQGMKVQIDTRTGEYLQRIR